MTIDVHSIVEMLKCSNLNAGVPYRYSQLDYLYLNAGIMPNPQFDVKAFFKGVFSR